MEQLELPVRPRGGRRRNAGRKPKHGRRVSHAARERFPARHPVHVTLRLAPDFKRHRNLRRSRPHGIIRHATELARDRLGCRIVAYSIQRNHIHLIVEAASAEDLGRAMRGYQVRLAKRLNAFYSRRGPLFGDRYHARILTNPRQVRAALLYVLQNARHHGDVAHERLGLRVDPFSSARDFDGWIGPLGIGRDDRPEPRPVVPARTWLLSVGWCLHHGPIHTGERPAPARPRR